MLDSVDVGYQYKGVCSDNHNGGAAITDTSQRWRERILIDGGGYLEQHEWGGFRNSFDMIQNKHAHSKTSWSSKSSYT